MALPRTISVIGAGQMGIGIALVASLRARIPKVLLYDQNPAQITKGLEFMDKLLAKDVSKGRISEEDAKATRERIISINSSSAKDEYDWARELGERGTEMVIEAASERVSIKEGIFRALARNLSNDAVLASNTSSISITKLAGAAVDGLGKNVSRASEEGKSCAGRVVGVHFFNPVPVMKLCEVIPGLQTSEATLERAKAFAAACGKEVTTSKDVPGFVSNALLMPFLNEAIMCLESGTATRDDIDKTLRLGMGHPMGPLQLADFIGLDTCLAIQETLYEGTRDSKYRPSILLGRMVDAGWLGKKSGKGFYDY
ncbi:3-hydroxyacyl-CoA dehydrogenase [Rhodocollybia butyracea]|uniref:3-hydroxyacyl-CoA dehydrogenase n=1 Tax=Rhodocollybia butyracea TaxID=206335 RepID=A0A9P5Q5N7_9AGAR|nr:3-hydroxyacyl-CoA dehydrogenase [Rhodocollybia butyracea]